MLKLALSSDKLAKLNQSLCALSFYSNKTENSPVYLELNEKELEAFIVSLEAAQNVKLLFDVIYFEMCTYIFIINTRKWKRLNEKINKLCCAANVIIIRNRNLNNFHDCEIKKYQKH